MTTLPAPRSLLTTLFNTFTTPPQATQPTTNTPYSTSSTSTSTSTSTNPLHALPPSHRALLTTLHVLFPPGMLLQSLDLLDRGLVTRITELHPNQNQNPHPHPAPQSQKAIIMPPQAPIHLLPEPGIQEKEETRKNQVYQVRSSQQLSRFKDHGGGKGQVYIVRLQAWSCTCAAFAFSSFPSSFPSQSAPGFGVEGQGEGFEGDGERDGGWEFGGLSFDGMGGGGGGGGGGVPVCKHLLACVLVERWGDVLGTYFNEREVGREEMAGLGAE